MRILDLFGGVGGAAAGYAEFGDVTCVDIAPQPDNPFRFVRADAIENPASRPDVVLCGEMFGLRVIRHRRFELGGWTATAPEHVKHRGRVAGMRHGVWYEGPYFAVYGEGGGKGTVPQWQDAMGIHWTSNRKSIAEAIPPAYTRWVASRFKEWKEGHGQGPGAQVPRDQGQ